MAVRSLQDVDNMLTSGWKRYEVFHGTTWLIDSELKAEFCVEVKLIGEASSVVIIKRMSSEEDAPFAADLQRDGAL